MKTLRLLIELEYDDNIMHGDDPESTNWFYRVLLDKELDGEPISKDDGLILHSNFIGDTVGSVKVLEIK